MLLNPTDRGHGDESPPVGVHHGDEGGAFVVLFEDVGQGGEDEDAHRHEQHEQTQLFVAVLQCEAQTLQTHGVTGKFENSGRVRSKTVWNLISSLLICQFVKKNTHRKILMILKN